MMKIGGKRFVLPIDLPSIIKTTGLEIMHTTCFTASFTKTNLRMTIKIEENNKKTDKMTRGDRIRKIKKKIVSSA